MRVSHHHQIVRLLYKRFFACSQVLLDACLTRSVLCWSSIRQEQQLLRDARPVVRDVRLLTDVLLAWRVWERAEPLVRHTLFLALRHLVSGGDSSPEHPSVAYNIRLLHSVGIVEKLLLIYLVRNTSLCSC